MKIAGIDLKRDADALIVGGVIAWVLAVLPIPGDPVGQLLGWVRGKIGGTK